MVTINDLTLNQDCSCISISTTEYHKIFNCEPFGEFYSSQTNAKQGHLNRRPEGEEEENDDILKNGAALELEFKNSDKDFVLGKDSESVSPSSSSKYKGKSPRNSVSHNGTQGENESNLVISDPSIVKNPRASTAFLKMLFSTSLTIIIPQSTSKLGNRLLKIYNLKQNLKICELTFPSNIINVRLNRKRLLVFLEIGQIFIYDLSCVRLIKVLEINTFIGGGDLGSLLEENVASGELIGDLGADDQSLLVLPLSVINDQTDLFNTEHVGGGNSASPSRSNSQPSTPLLKPSDSVVMHYPLDSIIELTHKNSGSRSGSSSGSGSVSGIAKKLGQGVSLEDLKKDGEGWILVYDTIKLRPRLIFKAHNSAIAKITISGDNGSIATASVKGTIIRVFRVEQNEDKFTIPQVINLRRGHNLAKINSLTFNSDNTILGCGSESNTIHFFKLDGDGAEHHHHDNEDIEDVSDNSDGDSRSENLNDNLASLLIEQNSVTPKAQEEESTSYFNFNLKKTSKLINNHYTKSIIKRLPYKDYFDNLIWEPPRRSFAYIKLPEYTPPPPHSSSSEAKNKVEIGFNGSLILLASYQTGIFYQYQLPKVAQAKVQKWKVRGKVEEDKRQECYLVNQYSLLSD